MPNYAHRKYVVKLCRDGKLRGTVRPYTMEESIEFFRSSYQVIDRGYITPCWIWNTASGPEYGTLYVGQKMCKAHRFSWELHFGKISDDLEVLHHCDIPQCVNPKHLFLGDQKANILDCVKKGRWKGGQKLTESQVLEIRRIYAEGKLGYRKLSAMFNISRGAILLIVRRMSWQHLP